MMPLSLYIHWPFCLAKCPYCDFNSHVRAQIDEDLWEAMLLQELHRAHHETGDRSLVSIFFGGGTPSLMHPQTVARLIETAINLWQKTDNLEITLEANPTSIEVEKFKDLRLAGVNRVSIGVQALNDAALKQLGRRHSATEALKAVEIGQSVFNRVSFDLIYARPGQALEDWRTELQQALKMGTEHLSLYQLTIEPGTAFAPLHARGELILPEEELAADLYEMTTELSTAHGLPPYEISNYARPGAECRHNKVYWAYGDYSGVGPGAHGRLTLASGQKVATRQSKAPETWLYQVEFENTGDAERVALSPQEQSLEAVMMGLRTVWGVDLTTLPVREVLDQERIDFFVKHGSLVLEAGRLKATPAGWLHLNYLLRELLTCRS